MNKQDLCTETEIQVLVHDFYARVRADALLGPIFAEHVQDWEHHLAKLVDFWSSTLRGTARFRGTPMVVHTRLPGLHAELFQRWLSLFKQTTATLGNEAMRLRANDLSERIAQSLWHGYQMQSRPEKPPAELQ